MVIEAIVSMALNAPELVVKRYAELQIQPG
jgi:hypothetical protein